jgi:superfamily II DNA or RNA helicase
VKNGDANQFDTFSVGLCHIGLCHIGLCHIGQKGYTLLKSDFDETTLNELKKTLMVRPVSSSMVASAPETEFPIYRESDKKIYIPRFFGQRHFGTANMVLKIGHGHPITTDFVGSLKPMQIPVVDAYLRAVQGPNGGGGLLELPCAFGKTVLSLNIIAQLKVKTLVIVNKEFLMNQWIERIGQFLPDAKVGRIQGPHIDIDGKDIVLGMLQSLAMKEYDDSVFSSFGLTIIDEVHHISSEVFSRSLFKIVTKYMLGLSATMDRKDGTTEVFKQFLGDVVFKGEREGGEFNVEVRAIEYVVDKNRDPAFCDTETDCRGNPKYSTMISKISEYMDRAMFIVRVLRDLITEQPGKQVMILAHTRSLLTTIGQAMEQQGFATFGFYVGGMKEKALKETEDKQVVLATYAMAAEALDIKTLASLILATPKTDIVQSVGRILRIRHDKNIVIDIVDMHDVFKRQWYKRRRYFKSCGYGIWQIRNDGYSGFGTSSTCFNYSGGWKQVNRSTTATTTTSEIHDDDMDDMDDDDDEEEDMGMKKRQCLLQLTEEELLS